MQTWIFELPGSTSKEVTAPSAGHDPSKKQKLLFPTGLALAAPFRSAAEARSYQYFEHKTGPFLSKATVYPRALFDAMVRSAWQCAASRNLLIALAITDELRSNHVADRGGEGGLISAANSMKYYTTAMGLMAREKYLISDLLIASILAWVFDIGHRRTEAARIHLNSAMQIVNSNTIRLDTVESHSQVDNLIKTVIQPTLEGNQNFHKSTSVLASVGIDDAVSESRLKLPETFLSVFEAVQSCATCFDLLHTGEISQTTAAAFGRNWLQRVRRYGARGGVSALQRWALYILYASLGTFIETLYLELAGIEAQIRWNYIIGQLEKIYEAEFFSGFTDVLALLIEVISWSCEHKQPITRSKRLMQRIRREQPLEETSSP